MLLLYGFLLSAIVAALALWRGSLSRSGAVGAVLVGIPTFGFGGPAWGVLMVLFFVTSSALSRFKEREKRAAAEKFEKGTARDFGQVMANGGLAALIAASSAFVPWAGWFPLFVGAIATANADTWATELGTLSRRPPRLITSGRVVEVGASGAVSALGTLAALAGGILIGLSAGLLTGAFSWWFGVLLGAVGGLAGSLADSLLGATVQAIRYCDRCRTDTETRRHRCGRLTRPLRGFPWLNNDGVNFLASIVGGVIALAAWTWRGP